MTPSWKEWLMSQRVVLLCRGTWTGWRKGLQESHVVQQSAEPCIWRGASLGTNTCWGPPGWKAALTKRIWRSFLVLTKLTFLTKLTVTQKCAPVAKKAFWAALGRVLPAGQGSQAFLSTQHCWGRTWSAVSSSGLPSARETWMNWGECSKSPLS